MIPKIPEDVSNEEWIAENKQEINLIYVGVTRGKYKVHLPEGLTDFIYI